jgi:phospholipid/cholesterol/gamma-HCH transport system substrate-binding protein
MLAETRAIVSDVKAGRGTVGQRLTDDALSKRIAGAAAQTEQTMANLQSASERVRGTIESVTARDGAAQQILATLRETMTDAREVVADLSEGTEALKRNFLFRGFFQSRGFFDLDGLSREAYLDGALEGKDRTALKVWVDAAGLFTQAGDAPEQLSAGGRRRLDSAMMQLARYPSDSPLVIEGYADPADGGAAYVVSADRAGVVRDYVLTRYRRKATLTGIMPMGSLAPESPRGDGRWAGVALALFVPTNVLR